MQDVAEFHSSAAPGAGGGEVRHGTLLAWQNSFSPNVQVWVDGEPAAQTVHMPWDDRFSGFPEFLQRCTAARLRVALAEGGGSILSYTLQVHADELARQLERGAADGEAYLVSLFRTHSGRMRLPASSPPVAQWPAAGRPPAAGAAAWMAALERDVAHRDNFFQYTSCVPLGSTGWSYDCTSERLLPWRDTAWLKVRFRGGVLSAGSADWRRAAVLQLVAADAPGGGGEASTSMLNTPATLVLAPTAEAARRWCALAADALGPGAVVGLMDGREPEAPLGAARLVVTTCAVLRSRAYTERVDGLLAAQMGLEPELRLQAPALLTLSRALAAAKQPVSLAVVELFHWRRVVADHVDEYLGSAPASRDRLRCLRALRASTWWGLGERAPASAFFLEPKLCDDGKGDLQHGQEMHPCLRAAIRSVLSYSGASA